MAQLGLASLMICPRVPGFRLPSRLDAAFWVPGLAAAAVTLAAPLATDPMALVALPTRPPTRSDRNRVRASVMSMPVTRPVNCPREARP